MKATQEWLFGNEKEKERRDQVAASGETVMLYSAAEGSTDVMNAPGLLGPDGAIVSPDLFVMGSHGHRFEEIKAKTKPSWRRTDKRYDHGFDYARLLSYEQAEQRTRVPILIAIREKLSPIDHEAPPCAENWEQRGLWLIQSLDRIRFHGRHVQNWPRHSGRGSTESRGGWLFPRWILHPIDPALQPEQAASIANQARRTL